MTILANHHDGIGCSYHRVMLPARHMGGLGTIAYWTSPALPPDDILKTINIFWFNRVPTCSLEGILRKRDEFRFKIVVDVDDHWILYPHHEMAAAWARDKAHEQIQECIRIADGVLVTNNRLKMAVQLLNQMVWVVPNALPYGTGQFQALKSPTDKVNFMYAGGTSHLHDLQTIQNTFKRLGQDSEFRATGEIVLAGYEQQFGMGKVNGVWERMLKVVKPTMNYSAFPMRPVDSYMECYKYADVALAPLEGSTFNAHKSNLKILEAGCMNIPIIASKVEPYIDESCEGLILCDTPAEWFDAIKRLLRSPSLRRDLGSRLGTYVRTYYGLGQQNDLRYRIFRRLV